MDGSDGQKAGNFLDPKTTGELFIEESASQRILHRMAIQSEYRQKNWPVVVPVTYDWVRKRVHDVHSTRKRTLHSPLFSLLQQCSDLNIKYKAWAICCREAKKWKLTTSWTISLRLVLMMNLKFLRQWQYYWGDWSVKELLIYTPRGVRQSQPNLVSFAKIFETLSMMAKLAFL